MSKLSEFHQENAGHILEELEQALSDWEATIVDQIGDDDIKISMGDGPHGEDELTDMVFVDPETKRLTIQELIIGQPMPDIENDAAPVHELCADHRMEILTAVQEKISD